MEPEFKATLKIFSTGSVTVTGKQTLRFIGALREKCNKFINRPSCLFPAPNVTSVQLAIEKIYPLLYEFRKEKPPPAPVVEPSSLSTRNSHKKRGSYTNAVKIEEFQDDQDMDEDPLEVEEEEEDPMSDASSD